MTARIALPTIASGWQVWHVIALVLLFIALVILAHRLRRKSRKSGQAAFLARCPDAAKFYAKIKSAEHDQKFKINAVNGARPCRFADRIGRGVFVPAGKSTVTVDDDRPVTLEFEAMRYGAYKLDKIKDNQLVVVEEIESL